MGIPGEGLRRLMPPQFQEAILVMIGAMAEQPETDQEILDATNRVCDHVAAEVVTIRHVSRLKKMGEA